MTRTKLAASFGFACLVLLLAPATGRADVTRSFSNTGAIGIPDSGAAAPYPSTINVSSAAGQIQDVDATINSFSHACPADVNILLVGPGGQKTILLSDAGGRFFMADCGPAAAGVSITLDDEASARYPCMSNPSGSFKPTDNACPADPDPFPAPAPGGPYPVSLTSFDGANPNGNWSLFVFDDDEAGTGTIAGGWSLTVRYKPSNAFSFGRTQRNKKKGIATLEINVPGPGDLSLSGNGVKPANSAEAVSATAVTAPGVVELLVKPKGKKRKKLNRKGKVKVTPSITFTPTGGDPSTQSTKLKLKKR